MKIAFLSLLAAISLGVAAQPRKIVTESTIQQVTVFTSGAQLHRITTVDILPGKSEIVFAGLSNQLEQQSIQLKADANITLLSVQAIKDYFNGRKVDQEEEFLNTQINDLSDKINSDTKLLEVYKQEEEILLKNQSIAGQNGIKPEDLKQMLDLQHQRLTDIYQKQLEIQKRIKEENKAMVKSTSQLLEISKKKDSINYKVSAIVQSKETQKVKFELVYTIRDAGWYPGYDIRVTDISKPLNILMNANVYQRSGESWKDVAIQLSTGSPEENTMPSQLSAWMLSYYDPTTSWRSLPSAEKGTVSGRVVDQSNEPVSGATISVKGSNVAAITDANGYFRIFNAPLKGVLVASYVGFQTKEIALKPGYYSIVMNPATQSLQEVVVIGYSISSSEEDVPSSQNLSKKKDEIQPVDVVTQYQPTTTLYKIEEKYTIETDGKTTTIEIKKTDVPALYQYFSVPKIDPSVFLNARITNWQSYEFLGGEGAIYVEGTYIGKTYIDPGNASDTLSLSLGKDNSILIGRKLTKEYSSKKLIGSNKTESRQYEITLRNTKKVEINIVVEDQVPVSSNKEISVEDVHASDAKPDKESGIVLWNLRLGPSQEKKLELGYNVKYPKEKTVVLE